MEQPDPGREVLELMCGAWLAQALYVAAELGIADLLAAGPMPVTALSSASGCADSDGLYRVLRLLASHGIFHEDDEQVFSLAPMGARLRSDVPGSMRDLVILYGAESYQAWGGLLHGVRTGESPFRAVFDDDLIGYLRARRQAGFWGWTIRAAQPLVIFNILSEISPVVPVCCSAVIAISFICMVTSLICWSICSIIRVRC